MSQRECAGFNWPPLSIPAQEPVSISPEVVSRAGPHIAAKSCNRCWTFDPSDLTMFNADSGFPVLSLLHDGVGHPANATICPSGLPVSHGLASFTPRLASVTVVVGQPASHAIRPSNALIGTFSHSEPSFQSLVVGVAHPVQSVSDVRRTDARRRKRDRPEGVTHCFQVSVYKVDPRVSVLACNLLSNNRCRLALLDEVMEGWPQVPLVIKPSSFACRAERLARTGTCPNRSVVTPSGLAQGVGPHANSGKEMALCEASQVTWENIFDTSFVHIAGRNVPGCNQVAQPLRGFGVVFVVVGGHLVTSSKSAIWPGWSLPAPASVRIALSIERTGLAGARGGSRSSRLAQTGPKASPSRISSAGLRSLRPQMAQCQVTLPVRSRQSRRSVAARIAAGEV